jgi:hypothetical protein
MTVHVEDILIYQNILENVYPAEDHEAFPGRLVAEVGRYLLQAPYASNTLEQEGPEALIVNLRAFDCFTFVETCLVLGRIIPTRRRSWNDFTGLLTQVRYRDGRIDGYASRLHYFMDWLQDNDRKGCLQDLSPHLEGVPLGKGISYMTDHADLYPPLSDPGILAAMKGVEKDLTNRGACYVPKTHVSDDIPGLLEGDLLGIVTAADGLDCGHAGIAVLEEGRLHLLHASRQAGAVVVSPEPLADYLRAQPDRKGLLVGRIR